MVARLLETCRSLKPSQKSPCHQIASRNGQRLAKNLKGGCWRSWHITCTDEPVLGTLNKRRVSNILQISDYLKQGYAIPMSPDLLSHVLAFIPGCSFIRRKETDQPATTLANEKSRKEYNKTSSIKRIRLCTWSGKNPEKSSAAISFLDYTSDYPPLFKVWKQQRRNCFPTPFPGSKTFQLYRSQNRS